MTCADSSFLLSLEGNDTNSLAATTHALGLKEPITISALGRLEVENATRLLSFRRVITAASASALLANFSADESAGLIVESSCSWPAVFRTARRISRTRTESEGYRLTDIVLVAVAIELRADQFLSLDERQRKLGAAEGLKVGP
jgi:predicted nucleic acid-binding protein